MRVTREGAKAGDRAACECGGKHKVDHRRVEPLRDDSKVVFQALLCVEHISQAEVHCEESVARRHTRWPLHAPSSVLEHLGTMLLYAPSTTAAAASRPHASAVIVPHVMVPPASLSFLLTLQVF